MHVSFDYGYHEGLRTNLPATYSKKKNTRTHLIAPHDMNHNGPEPEGDWIEVVREEKAGGHAQLQAACGLRGGGDEPFAGGRRDCFAHTVHSMHSGLPTERLRLSSPATPSTNVEGRYQTPRRHISDLGELRLSLLVALCAANIFAIGFDRNIECSHCGDQVIPSNGHLSCALDESLCAQST